jgi:asparagine synthase (glutamine-hydrolysing)
MCGIAGEYLLGPSGVVDPENIGPMLSVLGHRGPDDWGYYVDERRRAMLLHRRLSIVDVAGGHQPLSNEDGSIWTVFNGEIYDFERQARRLERSGHRLATRSDTEVIVHLYEEYGDDFVQHLRGEFALALYDGKRDELYLVRDRFGIKPLYYALTRNSVVFASEMKSLFRHPQLTAEFDPASVSHLLAGVTIPGTTLFRRVKQVEPGCLLRCSGGRVAAVRYWDLPFRQDADPGGPVGPTDEGDAVVEFRRLFNESVRLRLQGDVEAGVYLSGGIDSAAVARTMAGMSDRPVKAFTIGFDHPGYDETADARAIAAAGGMDHHVLRIRRGALGMHFAQSLWHSEIPVANGHGTAKYLLSRLTRSHVKVVLTGEGSDELLAGYNQFKHQQLLEAVRAEPGSRAARRAIRDFLAREGILTGITRATEYPEYERIVRTFGAYPYTIMRSLLYRRSVNPLLSRDFRRSVAGVDTIDELGAHIDRAALSGLSPTSASQYVLFKTDLPNYNLNYLGDRQEMAHSVEGRLPFLDHKLVEFVCRLPASLKLRGGCEKYLLRRSMSDLVPGALGGKKKVFLAPSGESLGLGKSNPHLESYFDPKFVREVGIFDPTMLNLVRHASKFLPKGGFHRSLCEGIVTFALSLHILHGLFCQDFAANADRYAWPLPDLDRLRRDNVPV